MTSELSLEHQQALVYAQEIRRLYDAERARAEELDITRRHLELALARIVEAERAREEFIANCSHELKTPLVPIMGWADLMQRGELSQEQVRQFAEVISRQSKRLLGVVESLLTISQIRHGVSRTLDMEAVEVTSLASRVLEPAFAAGRRVEIKGAPFTAWLNTKYVVEILQQLVSNALKFSAPDSVIGIYSDKRDRDVKIAIVDRGPGIKISDQDRIFEPFVQGDGGITRVHGGLGTGLFIARELAKAHGGMISLEDTPGGGATFALTLPQRRAEDETAIAS